MQKGGLLFALVVSANVAFADGIATTQTIHVGVYVNQINSLSLKANQFEVDFTIWFRGHTDDFNPLETFDVMDGQSEYVTAKTSLKVGEQNYASCRVVAKITKFWNVSRFPRDDHTLSIAIEDGSNEESKVRYVADNGCALSPRIRVPGWDIVSGAASITTERYNTNYGDTSLRPNESAYSRFDYAIKIVRPGWGYFWKLFSGLFVATGIAMLAFGIKPGDGRFGLAAGSIFAAVASQYITASNLPDTNILTMADLLHIVAFVFISSRCWNRRFPCTLRTWATCGLRGVLIALAVFYLGAPISVLRYRASRVGESDGAEISSAR